MVLASTALAFAGFLVSIRREARRLALEDPAPPPAK
jgi:hypothetical protein